jgi:transposase
MHELKEEIRKIFEQTNNWLTGLFQQGRWLASAKKYFPDSQNTIIRWLDEIIAYFDNRTTSGVLEGINYFKRIGQADFSATVGNPSKNPPRSLIF